MQENISNIIIYNDGELELKVSIEQESVWLNRNQIAELEQYSTVAKNATVQFEGGREVKRDIEYYNLDVIISIGYRVKSQKGVRFRQWATSILKNYIQNGYVINHHKIIEQRLFELGNDIRIIKSKIKIYTANITKQLKLDFQKYQTQYKNIELNELKNSHDRFLIIDKKEVYHL
jgi:hypothetical protein